MSLTGRLVGALAPGAPRGSVESEDTWTLRDALLATRSDAGQYVTVPRALEFDAVYAAVRLLSESGGSLPLKVYQRRRGRGGRAEDWDSDAYRLLHDEPNPESSAVDLWATAILHLTTWGNAYLAKERSRGEVVALWPRLPERMRVGRENGEKVYTYRGEDGVERRYGASDFIHIKGLSLDGLVGMSPIAYMRNAIGAALAGDQFGARFYANAAVPRGVLQVARELSKEAGVRLREQWESLHKGPANSNKVAVLEQGTEFKPITMPLEDAQFVETAKMSVQRIARAFGVPPEMIGGDTGGSLTYSTVEGQSIFFLTHGLRPWLTRIEQTVGRDRDLFPERRRYPEFVVDALLRAEAKSRAEFYSLALDPAKGWLNRDEVRELENRGPEGHEDAMTPMETATAVGARMERILADLRARPTSNGRVPDVRA